jgi:phage shock protein PspC (stress-responsive transcriptional regulator)
MSEQQQQLAPPRRLTRSTTDRMVAGVCGGLGEYTGIDPVIFRVVFAVATIMGGAGLIAYIVAWLVMPEADDEESHVESLLRNRQVPRPILIAVGVVAFFVVAGWFDSWGNNFGGGGFGLLVLVGLGVWFWMRHDGDASRVRKPASMPRATTEIVDDAVADTTVVTPPADRPLRAQRPPRPPRVRRQRSQLTGITISATLLAAGILAALHASNAATIDAGTALAICLIVLGAGLVVGAVYGRGRGLITLGVLLTAATAVATVADVSFAGGTGDRAWHPLTPAALEQHYELGAGHGVLDLRDLSLDGQTRRIEATLGMGHLEVDLPPGAEVTVDAHTGFGEVVLPGIQQGGVDVDRHVMLDGFDGRLELDLRVGMGRLEVNR